MTRRYQSSLLNVVAKVKREILREFDGTSQVIDDELKNIEFIMKKAEDNFYYFNKLLCAAQIVEKLKSKIDETQSRLNYQQKMLSSAVLSKINLQIQDAIKENTEEAESKLENSPKQVSPVKSKVKPKRITKVPKYEPSQEEIARANKLMGYLDAETRSKSNLKNHKIDPNLNPSDFYNVAMEFLQSSELVET